MEQDQKPEILPEYLLPPYTSQLVNRIPVKLNKKLKNLNLLQFPVNNKPINEQGIHAKWKKNNKKLQLSVRQDTRPIVWNNTTNAKFKGVDRLDMESISIPNVTNYYIGVIDDNVLYLNKVQNNLQLRVNLNYLNKPINNDNKDEDEAEVEGNGDEEKPNNTANRTSKIIGIQALNNMNTHVNQNSITNSIRKDEDEEYLYYGWREFNVSLNVKFLDFLFLN